ncbi:hypothetical protein ACFL04_04340 [Patescibacteria group bacterium]
MNNQKAFAHIAAVVVISVIALSTVGAMLYFKTEVDKIETDANVNVNSGSILSNTNTTINENTNANENANVNTNASEETGDGCLRVYNNEWYGYSAEYPCTWTYTETDISAAESVAGWTTRYVTFNDASGDYSLSLGVRQVGEEVSVGRTGLGVGEFVDGDPVSIGTTTVTPRYYSTDTVTEIVFYYQSTDAAPVINDHEIIAEFGGPDGIDIAESINFLNANDILASILFPEEVAADATSYTNGDCGQTITLPDGWYAHDMGSGHIIILQTETLPSVGETEGFAFGTQIGMGCGDISEAGASTGDEFLDNVFGTTDVYDVPIVRTSVVRNGLNMTRFTTSAAGAEGQVLHYYYYNGTSYHRLDHWAYDAGTPASQDFEDLVNSFSAI